MINLGGYGVKVLNDGWTAVTRDRSLSRAVRTFGGRHREWRRDLHALAQRLGQAPLSLMFRAPSSPRRCWKSRRIMLGHRERLRARFLERRRRRACPIMSCWRLVLFAAIPRRDVKPLAKSLLERFGSFADVIAAPRERLMEVKGVGEAVIAINLKIVEAAALRLAKTQSARQARAAAPGPRCSIIARRRWRARPMKNSACCSSTARMC